MNIGGGVSNIEDSGNKAAFTLGYDLAKTLSNGLEAGLAFDLIYSDAGEGYKTNMSGDIGLLIGYDFSTTFDVPIVLRGAVGYGYGVIMDTESMSGMVYSAAAEYELNKHFGFGAEYKVQDFEIDLAGSTAPAKTTNVLAYFYFRK